MSLSSPGAGERDRLIGGSGTDIFVLGNEYSAFYDDDGTTVAAGNVGRAIIRDLDVDVDVDKIVLHGSASDYELHTTSKGHTQIFLVADFGSESGSVNPNVIAPSPVRDLIGVVLKTTGLELSDSTFEYVSSVM